MPSRAGFPPGGRGLLVPLTDAQFEAAVEALELDLPPLMLPEGSAPAFLGVLRARHGGMLTHWAEVRAVDRPDGDPARVSVKIGPLTRFPRPIEWREHREVYRPIDVEAEALRALQSLDDIVDRGGAAAADAIVQAARFIELAPPKLDMSLVNRKSFLDRAASFAVKEPGQALDQIDAAVMELLRDLAATLYGESAEEDASRDGWFGEEKFQPTVEAYFELLREADEKEIAGLLTIVEHYLVVRNRAQAVESAVRPVQITDLIAVAQAVFDAAAGH